MNADRGFWALLKETFTALVCQGAVLFEEGPFMSFNTKRLVESAIMIALGTVLSLFTFAGPWVYGGGITICSMLPLVILCPPLRHEVGLVLCARLRRAADDFGFFQTSSMRKTSGRPSPLSCSTTSLPSASSALPRALTAY